MSTNKPRIQAYVISNLYYQFERERLRWGISQSQALERILGERYGTDNLDKKESDLSWTAIIADLQARVRKLELEDSELSGELPSESGSELPKKSELPSESGSESGSELPSELQGEFSGELPSELQGELPGELPSELQGEFSGELPSELQGELPGELEAKLEGELDNTKPHTQRALAKRLSCSHSYINKLRKLGKFEAFSKEVDPEGKKWIFKDGKYYPLIEAL